MKKYIALFAILAMALSLCACGSEEIVVPTKPEQSAVQDQPAADQTQNAEAEEGYRTYYYSKDVSREVECIADETGKLVKLTENGTVNEDPAYLAQIAASYHFKS